MTITIARRVAPGFVFLTLTAANAMGCPSDTDEPAPSHMHDTSHAGAPASGGSGGKSGGAGAGGQASESASTDSKAVDLRVSLNLLLSEHLIFAAKATGAALGGRADEFTAYGDLLNANGGDVGDMIGAAFGAEAKTKFNGIWSAHNGYFVDYTKAVAGKDDAKKAQAVKDLTENYVPDFSKFISDATGLPLKDVTDLTTQHVLTTKAIVDAQAAKDWPATYSAIRAGFAHMAMIGDPLAAAIAKKFPAKFPGDPSTNAVGFRVALNELLQEHMFLATFATGAALGGRSDEFTAAGDALNDNGTDIGDAIGQLYGDDAKTQFNGIWSAHNGYFVAYTQGVAGKDDAKKAQAVKDLTETFVPDFAKFIGGATALPTKAVSDLTTQHVLATKAVVDAQAGSDVTKAAAADREAGQHMQMIGDPLSAAIVAKLPAKF
jgi:hypothetical protein